MQVPAELRSSGLTVSFLNKSGDTEKWEFSGGSWAAGSFSQVGAKIITGIGNNSAGNWSMIQNKIESGLDEDEIEIQSLEVASGNGYYGNSAQNVDSVTSSTSFKHTDLLLISDYPNPYFEVTINSALSLFLYFAEDQKTVVGRYIGTNTKTEKITSYKDLPYCAKYVAISVPNKVEIGFQKIKTAKEIAQAVSKNTTEKVINEELREGSKLEISIDDFTDGYYSNNINNISQGIVSNSGFCHSDILPISELMNISATIKINGALSTFLYLGSDKDTVVGRYIGTNTATESFDELPAYPDSAKYFCISCVKSSTVNITTYSGGVIKKEIVRLTDYSELQKKIDGISNIELIIPDNIYLSVGIPFQIYNRNVIRNINSNVFVDYYLTDSGGTNMQSIVNLMQDGFKIKPTTAGTYNLRIDVYYFNILLFTKNINVIVSNNASKQLSAMWVGDSNTDYAHQGGLATSMIKKIYDAMTPNLQLIGISGESPYLINARAGVTAAFFAKSKTHYEYNNPFINPSTGVFDFSYYMSQHLEDGIPNIVIFQLGTNDAFQTKESSEYIDNMDLMVQSVISYNSDIMVGVALPMPSAFSQDPFGLNNKQLYTHYTHINHIFDFNKNLIEKYKNTDRVYLIPLCENLDCVNNYPFKNEEASDILQVPIRIISDAVHPEEQGKQQMANTHISFLDYIATLVE